MTDFARFCHEKVNELEKRAQENLSGAPCMYYMIYNGEVALLTVSGHSELEAFGQPAGLASVSVDPIYHAVLLPWTVVVDR